MQSFLQDLTEQVRGLLLPKAYFQWQTLMLLSLFSLIVAVGIESLEPDNAALLMQLLSTLSWIFFITAVWWALAANPIKVNNFSISPWLTGALLCVFFFRPWTLPRLRWAISSWPMISTAVMALSKDYFINWELKTKLPKPVDQRLLITTLLINLLLSSWIVFNFRVQDWVTSYPSLLVNGLENNALDHSAFVYDFAGSDRKQQPQGVLLLNGMANSITDELENLPWYQTERWLLNRQDRMKAMSKQTLRTLSAPAEEIFWQMVVPVPRQQGEGYLLRIRANWLGPAVQDSGFFVEKSCRIMPEEQVRAVPVEPDQPPLTSQVTAVSCDAITPTVNWIKAG